MEKLDASSFPSIHAARATFLFIILSKFLFVGDIYGAFLGFMLFLVFYSRVYLKKHYWIDVIVGGVVGWLVGIILT